MYHPGAPIPTAKSLLVIGVGQAEGAREAVLRIPVPRGRPHWYQGGRSLPNGIASIDDGHGSDNPVMRLVGMKGERDVDDQTTAETMCSPRVHAFDHLGDWRPESLIRN